MSHWNEGRRKSRISGGVAQMGEADTTEYAKSFFHVDGGPYANAVSQTLCAHRLPLLLTLVGEVRERTRLGLLGSRKRPGNAGRERAA